MKWTFYCKEIVERRNKRNVFLRQNECLFCLIHLDIEGRWIDQDKRRNNFSDETVLFTSNEKRIFIFGTFSKQTLVYNLLEQWKSFLINKEKSEKYDKCFSSKTGPTVCQRIHHSDEKWEIANQERKVSTSHTLRNSKFTFLINCRRKKNSSLSFRMRCNLSCL
jgi:hypothetical protein